ncbi:MAG: hypothetical protein PHR13_09805 [Dysgonamonadaceae bacterium]|jgi:hypothetical protein|nr:hypothetical protein [Dysgonamonadaceae bacterium]MDD3901255.1 hypothetical protein [Dysgonamonadaceae bacterium]MDD4399793.1 hypothetical protein [Dysgonamonadaceae bacterium]
MKTVFTIILTLFFWLNVFATAQESDQLIYNGKMYSLSSNPLESYFEKYPDKRPRPEVMTSSLWRGYVATFEIRDSMLYVKDISVQYLDNSDKKNRDVKWKSVLKEVFPKQKEIKVDWLTGLLVLPYGELVNYVHMGYGSTYENYILLEFNSGRLKNEKHFKYDEYERFKERQFQKFKQTDKYKKIKADLQKDGGSDEFIDSFLRSFATEYTSNILTE